MAVKTYSLDIDGNVQVAKNFKVREFACKDETSKVLIDEALPRGLQGLRNYFGTVVSITSAYRTSEHNKKVGGASSSQHLYGKASDIKITGVKPAEVCKIAQTLGFKGVGVYDSFSHVDTRDKVSYFKNGTTTLKTHGGYSVPTVDVKSGSRNNAAYWVQIHLKAHGFDCGKIDGWVGTKTDAAIRLFQKAKGLKVDGWVGLNTRNALKFF